MPRPARRSGARIVASYRVASYDTLLTDAFADQTGMGLL
jgi:hypothetical protein